MNTTIQNTTDLLGFLLAQSELRKDWFGFAQQKLTGIQLAHQIAANHADKLSPEEVVAYVTHLNTSLYKNLIRG